MFGIRTIFLVAATTLATVSFAAPTGVNQAAQAVGVDHVANNLLGNVEVHDVHVTGVKARRGNPGVNQIAQLVAVDDVANGVLEHVDVHNVDVTVLKTRRGNPGVNQVAQLVAVDDVANGVLEHVDVHNVDVTVLKTRRADPGQTVNGKNQGINADGSLPALLTKLPRNGPASFPVLLNTAQAQLQIVLAKLHTSANGKPNVDVKILVGIVGDVQTILCTLLDGVKLIIGHPIDFVLCLDGKVLALVDVCALLTSVLSLVCVILSCVIRLVGSANLHIVAPLVAGVGAVLCELLPCIFQLVPGILVALSPVSGTIINAFIGLKLDAVATLLKAH